jgi:hypothetical protein
MHCDIARQKNYQQRHSRENGNPERYYIAKNIRLNEKHLFLNINLRLLPILWQWIPAFAGMTYRVFQVFNIYILSNNLQRFSVSP